MSASIGPIHERHASVRSARANDGCRVRSRSSASAARRATKTSGAASAPVISAAARVAHARSSSDQIARVPSVVSTARRSVTRRAADSFIGSLELVDVLRPALVKQTGKRPVSEDLPAGLAAGAVVRLVLGVDDPLHRRDRKSTRLNSSHVATSYAVFCLKKKKTQIIRLSSKKKKRTTKYKPQ